MGNKKTKQLYHGDGSKGHREQRARWRATPTGKPQLCSAALQIEAASKGSILPTVLTLWPQETPMRVEMEVEAGIPEVLWDYS